MKNKFTHIIPGIQEFCNLMIFTAFAVDIQTVIFFHNKQ
jgi:hypothetical protein